MLSELNATARGFGSSSAKVGIKVFLKQVFGRVAISFNNMIIFINANNQISQFVHQVALTARLRLIVFL